MSYHDQDADIYLQWSESDTPYRILEWYVFLRTIGSVRGLNVLDLACGDGRVPRALMERGAAWVVGTDISSKMIEEARALNSPGGDGPHFEHLRYEVVDACNQTWTLDPKADLVTAMYLFHYASNEDDLFKMCHQIGRSLKGGGRFVTYTVNPDYDFEKQYPDMEKEFGFRYRIVAPPKYELIIGGFAADIWQWGKSVHEEGLKEAGLKNIRWHPLELPPEHQELEPQVEWYLKNPSLIVLSASK